MGIYDEIEGRAEELGYDLGPDETEAVASLWADSLDAHIEAVVGKRAREMLDF